MSSLSTWRARLSSSLASAASSSISGVRHKSQSTSIPKKLQRVRDHGFDDLMEVEKKVRRALKLQELILSHPGGGLPVSRLESLARRHLKFASQEAGSFLLRHPHVFHVFEHPVQRILWTRLTPRALQQLRIESDAISSSLPSAAVRLRRLLLLAAPSFRLRLEHIRLARTEFGLPEDFEQSIVLAHPSLFRLLSPSGPDAEPRLKFVEAVPNSDEPFPIAAVELAREREYRSRGSDAQDARFAFPIQFPPGFKIGKYYRVAVWKWQRLPYWSPYEDVSSYDLRTLEARRRMEKRAVATIHEFLSLTVERRTTLERIAHFRQAMGMPSKLKEFLLQHQGIFYISTRGNQGKLHTVFLREAYKKGQLLEENDVYLARKRLRELLLMSPQKVNFDRMLTSLGREGDGFHHSVPAMNTKEFFQDEDGSGSDSGVESQFID
ncbi:hypothetical protein KSP39_PZI013253 [Platanthera zijinensis]|uniref:PORR domain-containing protein n=1 Tax=Platanthera zijinensis TaxID=2320716 RepID=A0AAP0BFP7_9ASPA